MRTNGPDLLLLKELIERHRAHCGRAMRCHYSAVSYTLEVYCDCGFADNLTDEERCRGERLARCACGDYGPVCYDCRQIAQLGAIVTIDKQGVLLP